MFRLLVFSLLLLICIEGCSSSSPVLKTEKSEGISKVDSLRATFSIEFQKGQGSFQKFSGVLFSVPNKRYRLELSGPMGIGVASLLWTDSLWSIVFPTEKTYMQGNGYLVGMIGNPDFPLVNIHQVAAFFEQKILPESYEEISSRDSLDGNIVSAKDNAGMPFSFYKKENKVLWFEKGTERVYFRFPEILVQQQGKDYLKINVKKVKTDATWNASIWRLFIPVTFRKI